MQPRQDIAGMAIRNGALAILVTDPRLDDNPIVFANDAFERLTLYSREQILGRNCRFLQGPATDMRDAAAIMDGLRSRQEFQVRIVNYKADGTPFLNEMLIAPVESEQGELVAYFAVQRDVSREASRRGAGTGAGAEEKDDETLDLLRELQHRVKNHLAMIVGMIRIQATREVTPASLTAISRRIEALGLLYDEMCRTSPRGAQSAPISAGPYLTRVASVLADLEGRPAIGIDVHCDDVQLSPDAAARFGLLLSELLTNALDHAFAGRENGHVTINFRSLPDGTVRLSVEDDGVGLPDGFDWPRRAPSIRSQTRVAEEATGALDTTGQGSGRAGVGGSIVLALAQSLRATLNVERRNPGTAITVDVVPNIKSSAA